MKTKGRIEEALLKLDYPFLAIFRPGLLQNRDGESRTAEKVFDWVPFVTKI